MDPVPFVPDDFAPPTSLETPLFRLEPLGPQHNEADYAAWTSSLAHIRRTPGYPDGRWPDDRSIDDNLRDLRRHATDFEERRGFTYTVLDRDTADVVGCVYIYPDATGPRRAVVQSWVRASRAELDVPLWRAVSEWLAEAWPFDGVAYGTRDQDGDARGEAARGAGAEAVSTPSTPLEIETGIDAALGEADSLVALAVAHADTATFDSSFGSLDDAVRCVRRAYGRFGFLSSVHPDPDIRDAAAAASTRLESWRTRVRGDEGVRRLVTRHVSRAASLPPDDAALLARWHREVGGDRAGSADEARAAELEGRLMELVPGYHAALWAPVLVRVPEEQVAHLPAGVEAVPGEDGAPVVPLTDPVVNAILEGSPHRGLRERVSRAWLRRGLPLTATVMQEVTDGRRTIARLRGHESWLDYRADELAIGGRGRVEAFLRAVEPDLVAQGARELAAMTELLRDEQHDREVVIEEWDWRYLDARQRAAAGADPATLREYLPFEAVLDGLWRVSDEVFGVRVVAVPDRPAWHPDVRAYDLIDRDRGELIAHLYLDPFARPGKAGRAYMDELDPPGKGPGTYMLGSNAPAPGPSPSTLGLDEVDQLFHEYGHVLDFALGRSRWLRLGDDWLQFDWVEAPSLFLGRLGQHPRVLATMARHVVTGDPLPASWGPALDALESLNAGIRALRFLSMARLDALLHGPTPVSLADADRAAWAVRGLPYLDGTSFAATFLHLLGGYGGAAYGFLWDQALRDDIFAAFEPTVLDARAGMRYRASVLEAPWTTPPVEALESFLGRPWSVDAFLRRTVR